MAEFGLRRHSSAQVQKPSPTPCGAYLLEADHVLVVEPPLIYRLTFEVFQVAQLALHEWLQSKKGSQAEEARWGGGEVRER